MFHFLILAQAAAGTTLEIPSWLVPSVFAALLAWLIKKSDSVGKKLDTVRDEVREISQWAKGIDGTNGANSKINKLREDVDELQSAPVGDLAKMLRYDGPENREADDRRAEDRVLLWFRDMARRASEPAPRAHE